MYWVAYLFGADEVWKGNEILLRQGWRLMLVVFQKHPFFIKPAIYIAKQDVLLQQWTDSFSIFPATRYSFVNFVYVFLDHTNTTGPKGKCIEWPNCDTIKHNHTTIKINGYRMKQKTDRHTKVENPDLNLELALGHTVRAIWPDLVVGIRGRAAAEPPLDHPRAQSTTARHQANRSNPIKTL
jgi:hypothetical protein